MFTDAILNPLMKDLEAYRDLVRCMKTRCLWRAFNHDPNAALEDAARS